LNAELERIGGAEEQAAHEGADRRPAADDDRSEGEIAAAVRHAVGERTHLLEGQHGAADASERARADHGEEPHADRIGAAGERGRGILADRAQREPGLRPLKRDEQHHDEREPRVGEGGLSEQEGPSRWMYIDSPRRSNDAFVAKLDAAGSALIYSTYLGGSDIYYCDEYGDCYAEGDFGKGIAVDSAGNAYVTGTTSSFHFPTANALQPAVDSAGNAYVTGGTTSSDFPTANPLQPRRGGFITNAFVAKLDAAGTELVYSTYLGGSEPCGYYLYGDIGSGIAFDSAGNAYVAGVASSVDFPTVNALQPRLRGCRDAFVAKLNAVGSALVYSTYLGGAVMTISRASPVDSAGNAYVTGSTFSSDFPMVNAMTVGQRGRFKLVTAAALGAGGGA
jgi:hypothetical protein